MALSDAVFKIDGVVVAQPQFPYKPRINTSGVWYRNMQATRVGYIVANNKTLFWNYNSLTDAELEAILAIMLPKIEAGNDIFSVTSYMPGKGDVTDYYYPAAVYNFDQVGPDKWKWELNWVQVYGKKTL